MFDEETTGGIFFFVMHGSVVPAGSQIEDIFIACRPRPVALKIRTLTN